MENKFNLESKEAIKLLTYLSFFASFFYTAKLMLSEAYSPTDKIIAIIGVIIFECSKCLFLHLAITKKNLAYGVITIVLFGFSICASLAYMINNSNKIISENIKKTSAYQEIQNLKDLRDGYAENRLTTKADMTREIIAMEKELGTDDILASEGNHMFFEMLSKYFNMPVQKVNWYFNFFRSITLEILVLALYYAYKKSVEEEQGQLIVNTSHQNLNVLTPQKTQMYQPTENTMLAHADTHTNTRSIIQNQEHDFTNEQLEKYKTVMFEVAEKEKTNIAPGVRTICQMLRERGIEISDALGFKIKSFLEVSKIVESRGQKTFILTIDKVIA